MGGWDMSSRYNDTKATSAPTLTKLLLMLSRLSTPCPLAVLSAITPDEG